MELKFKNSFFQLLIEISTHVKNQEEDIFIILDKLTSENPHINKELSKISNLLISLHGDMKYQFFEWGIIAEKTLKTTNFDWKNKMI